MLLINASKLREKKMKQRVLAGLIISGLLLVTNNGRGCYDPPDPHCQPTYPVCEAFLISPSSGTSCLDPSGILLTWDATDCDTT